jgi:hypothetical protein
MKARSYCCNPLGFRQCALAFPVVAGPREFNGCGQEPQLGLRKLPASEPTHLSEIANGGLSVASRSAKYHLGGTSHFVSNLLFISTISNGGLQVGVCLLQDVALPAPEFCSFSEVPKTNPEGLRRVD